MNYENMGKVYSEDPNNKALSWDAEIEDTSDEFKVLQPGEYDFMVTKMDREQFDGSAKMPPCPKASIVLEVESEEGKSRVFDNLFLTQKSEWKIAQFFRCLGLIEKGYKGRVPWDKVIGARGKCQLKVDSYNGKERNRVDSYLFPENPNNTGYVAGKF